MTVTLDSHRTLFEKMEDAREILTFSGVGRGGRSEALKR